MENIIQRLSVAIKNAVTRGALLATSTQTPFRPLLNVSSWFATNYKNVELMQPYGMSSNPTAGDVLLLQVGGTRDHLIAPHVDDVQLRIPDLLPGEFGFRDLNEQQYVFRQDRIEITNPKQGNTIVVNSNGTINMTTQSGDMNYSVQAGKHTIVASGDVDVTSSGGTINMTASNIVLNGTVQVNGTVTATGEGTFNGGHTVSQHVHPGVQTGDGSTQTPTG